MMTSNARRRGVGVLIAALVVATTLAQEPSSAPSPATRPSSVRSAEPQTHAAAATQPDATSAPAEGAEVRAVLVMGGPARLDTGEPPPTNHWVPFWPDLGPGTLGWFAALAILALMLRPRPLLSLRNLDGLVLAGMCLLLVLREDTRVACYRQTGQWWAYIGLTAAAAYWLVRGIGLLLARRTQSPVQPVPSGPLTILVIVGLVLAVHQIATAPVSDGSRDGIIGGLYSEATGRLPFGEPDVPDSRSPLLYLLHASALRVAEPTDITVIVVRPGYRDVVGQFQSRVIGGQYLLVRRQGLWNLVRRFAETRLQNFSLLGDHVFQNPCGLLRRLDALHRAVAGAA